MRSRAGVTPQRLQGRFRRAAAAAVCLLLLLALPARAALFDDDEARRRIEATRQRLEQLERTLSARVDALETTVKNQALVDLFRDVEQIKADIAKLRGQYEVLTYELEQAQKRQRDLYLDLDSRLRKLETAPAAAPVARCPRRSASHGYRGAAAVTAPTFPGRRPEASCRRWPTIITPGQW